MVVTYILIYLQFYETVFAIYFECYMTEHFGGDMTFLTLRCYDFLGKLEI
jgi:hypothetical protein